jgi:pyruvate/2-oxoglutarate dehydrogenase complex dihydrolipoamide dehydrogenase (E3) component
MVRHFDSIIIGAGQAGIPLAGRLAEAGQTVALIERGNLGGTCVNTGCTPTKTLIASAYVAHSARRANDFGVLVPETVEVDLRKVMARKNAVVSRSQNSLAQWVAGMTGCSLIRGEARFVGKRTVAVNGQTFAADRVFINVGARPSTAALPGLDTVATLNSDGILQLEQLPRHLVIVGGGYIGLEFGQMFRRFGSDVTIIEMGERLLPHEDADFAKSVHDVLIEEGISIRYGAKCIALSQENNSPAVQFIDGAVQRSVTGSHVLLATGRTPNTDCIDLQLANIEVDDRGFIKVNDELETSAESVWALGDCNGKGAFTHTSYNDYEIVASNLLGDQKRRVSERIPAHALYVDPPLAQVGMTEAQVRASGRKALIATRPMTRVGRAVEKGESKGFMKVLVDAETLRILGAGIQGVGGDEAIHCILDVMYAGAPYTVLLRAVHIHPTVSELIPTLLGDLRPLT